MSARIAMQHTALHSLVNLAERCIQTGLNCGLRLFPGGGTVGITSAEAALHERAHRRLVSLVLQAVALSDLDALLRGLVIGHRAFDQINNPQP